MFFFSNFGLDIFRFFVQILNERITKSFCLRPLTNVLTRKSNARLGGPHFGSKSPLYGAKLQSNARDMPGARGEIGGFGTDLYVIQLMSDPRGNS